MKNIIFISALLIVSAQALSAQPNGGGRSSIALWTSAGYSSILNHSPVTQASGGLGNALGVGYEFRTQSGFLLHAGAEASRYSSLMNRNSTTMFTDMLDTEGNPFEGIFSFDKIKDHQSIINAGPSLLFGFKQPAGGLYFLLGGKVLLNIYGTEKAESDVTLKARYANIIGDDDDGIISNMPNHGLKTDHRSYSRPLSLNPLLIASAEGGYVFPSANSGKAGIPEFRLSVFCDYGFSSVSKSETDYDLIINTTNTGEYLPLINPYLHHEVESQFFNTLFAGLKFTLVFNMPKKYDCKCDYFLGN